MRNLLPRRASLRFGCTSGVLAIGILATLISPAAAATGQRSAVDRFSQEFSVRISNPIDGVSLPSIVSISGAELSTTNIVGVGVLAPEGQIYLTFSASAGPVQLNYGQANWGHFFSSMRPLAPSAITFRSGAGRRYVAHGANPVNQANNPNAASDDGLLDATYWFLVPSNTRSGVISIGPATTAGTEFRSFIGQSTTLLHVAGPLNFKVSFPKLAAPVVRQTKSPTSLTSSNSTLNELLTILSLILFGWIFWRVRRRMRARM